MAGAEDYRAILDHHGGAGVDRFGEFENSVMYHVNRQSSALPDVNYLIVGLGVTGFSVARFLLRHGYRCRIQDTRDVPPCLSALGAEFDVFDFRAQPLTSELIDWADVLVVSPGLSIRQTEIQRAHACGKTVLGDVELFARLVTKPVIAITGSNGKSTVTTLVGDMINRDRKRAAVGGNIGTAALDLLDIDADFYVLELSSYQLETTSSLKPEVGALLNLCEDHLDRYASYRDYIETKLRVYRHAKQCVSNLDDPVTQASADEIRFSLDPDSNAEFRFIDEDGGRLAHRNQALIDVEVLKIQGRHNWANCLAAMAITHCIGVSHTAMVTALREFTGIPHRSQWVANINGVEWINDSKATNIGAARASIEGCDKPVVLIAGGQAKGADMSYMAKTVGDKVELALLLGEDAAQLEQAWQAVTRIERVADMRQAVQRAHAVAQVGDCVLLAPACASFDMYSKFEARGDDFMRHVKELDNG